MKLTLIKSPLSIGETWEKTDERTIAVSRSSKGDPIPTVYFGIFKGKKITEDLFLTSIDARKIARALINESKKIDKERDLFTSKKDRRSIKALVDFKAPFYRKIQVYKGDTLNYTRYSEHFGTLVLIRTKFKNGNEQIQQIHIGKRNSEFNKLIAEGKCVEVRPVKVSQLINK